MTKVEIVYNTMKDVTDKTPVLLVEGAAFIFKRLYKGNIYRLENTEDVKEFITNFYDVEYDKPIVVEDLSNLYRDSMMLKIIEEIKLPLILLASRDNLSTTLQSRIKTYLKFPNDDCFTNSNISIKEAQQYIVNKDLKDEELDKYLAENCSDLAFIYEKVKTKKNKDKLIQILGSF